jgi:predicted ferric reductase
LWLSMALGIMITNKMARAWPGGPVAFDLHEYASLIGLAFALFHAIILTGDRYINLSLLRVAVPFTSADYRPVWVGLGQLSFYTMAIVTFSFYVRKRITPRAWRLLHYLSFLTFLLALAHGIFSGTDTASLWVSGMYWASGGLLLFLFVYRMLMSMFKPARPVRAAPVRKSA